MKSYNIRDIEHALNSVNLEPGDVVLVHSSLFHLGRYVEGNNADICTDLIHVLKRLIGNDGIIAAPAFNFDFCKGIAFDRWNTPSKGMGVLSEAIRNWPGAQRSKHPMQSVATIGGLDKNICERDTPSSFSIDGPFHVMKENNAKLLFIGAPFQAASLIHYTEERLNVPYRYWKSFSGKYSDKDIEEDRSYDMFVRDLELEPELNLHILQEEMDTRDLIYMTQLGMGNVICCNFNDFLQVSMEMLSNDPYSLLKNRENFQDKLSKQKV